MGQKVHPYGFRVGITKNWISRWFNMKEYPEWLKEDKLIRDYIQKRIERSLGQLCRPAIPPLLRGKDDKEPWRGKSLPETRRPEPHGLA